MTNILGFGFYPSIFVANKWLPANLQFKEQKLPNTPRGTAVDVNNFRPVRVPMLHQYLKSHQMNLQRKRAEALER